MRNSHIAVLTLAAMALLSAACTNAYERSTYRNVGPEGWIYSDTVVLEADPHPAMIQASDKLLVAPKQHRDLVAVVRHTNGYEYNNIWIELTYWLPDTMRVDTFDVRLADDIGHWYGTGVGVGYQRADTLLRNVPLREDKPVLLRHIMRCDTLRNIEQAGIVVL